MRGAGRNTRKVLVLAALARCGWLRPRELHAKAGFPLAASPWSYLHRLQKWGLVRPRHVAGGQEWRLTRRGYARLQWLLGQ